MVDFLVFHDTALPDDYAERFAVRVSAKQCCAVVVPSTPRGPITNAKPQRCKGRRTAGTSKGDPPNECCAAHAKLELQARDWMKRHG